MAKNLLHTSLFALLVALSCILPSCKQNTSDQLFSRMSSHQTGIEFTNVLRETEDFNVMKYGYFYNGGGVAVGDINNDNLPDIYLSGNLVASKLYINLGNWQFKDVTEEAGVAAAGLWNTGVSMADVNGDGWLDIYVSRSAAQAPAKRKNLLFINQGVNSDKQPAFKEMAEAYGLADQGYTTQTAFFDYDRDGDLDAYVLNHSVQEYAGFSHLSAQQKLRTNSTLGDKLYRNDMEEGAEHPLFTDVSKEAGIIQNVLGFGLGISITDVNTDGWYDIYISNDYNEEDYLYINQQDGTFAESLRQYMNHVSLFSMGSDAADINNDALPDLISLDMLPESNERIKMSLGPENYDKYQRLINSGFHYQTMRNMLQLNNGNNTFSEVGQMAGVSSSDWSWAALIADYDLDGWKDIFVSNGYARNYLDMDFMNYVVSEQVKNQRAKAEVEIMGLVKNMPSIDVPNYIYQNQKGIRFKNMASDWGLAENTQSNGAAYADFDNDGDLDLIVNNVNEEVYVYQNNSESLTKNHFLKVRLSGSTLNSLGIGAKVYLYAAGESQYQEMMTSRGFQSSVHHELVFGLGNKPNIDSLKVIWPDGKEQTLQALQANQTIRLSYQEAKTQPKTKPADRQTAYFTPVPNRLGIDFKHQENTFLDFKRDKQLPYGISNLGPAVAKGDINGDGYEDLFLGGAKGQSAQLYLQSAQGYFSRDTNTPFEAHALSEDTDALFFDADLDNDLDLYVVSGGSDFQTDDPALQDRLYLNDGNGKFRLAQNQLPEMLSSGATVSVADLDNDGDPDLFVGGRLVPSRYPSTPQSYLLQNNGEGQFTDITQSFAPELSQVGMVSDAQFEDIDQDGFVDLIFLGEWMPIQIYRNNNGSQLQTQEMPTLSQSHGWWNTLYASDFDQDGDTDFIAGNFGSNHLYHVNNGEPARMIYKDFDNNGSIDPIFTHYLEGEEVFAYSKDELLGQIISLKKQFSDYKSFSKTLPKDFFTKEQLQGADTLYAYLLESVYLENESGTLQIKALPDAAQLSPTYAIHALDINQDNQADPVLAGNQSLSRVSTGRYDANFGVALDNQKGTFLPISYAKSGLSVRGDVRAIFSMHIKQQEHLFFVKNNDSLEVYQIAANKPPL